MTSEVYQTFNIYLPYKKSMNSFTSKSIANVKEYFISKALMKDT